MARVQYTYIVAYVYHSMSFVLCECLQGRTCLSTTTAGNLFVSWIFLYLVETVRDGFYYLSVGSIMHLKCCICFTKTEKKNPFSSSVIFAQSLTYVFLTLSGKSQDSPYTAQGAVRKVLFGEGNQSLSMLISFPTKNLKETEVVERQKSFFFLFALS